MALSDIVVPDIGDAREVEVAELLVAPGAHVEAGDPIVVLESDKASVEIPAPEAGTLHEFLVAPGDKVNEGQALARMETSAQSKPAANDAEEAPRKASPAAAASAAAQPAEAKAAAQPADSAEPEPPAAAAGAGQSTEVKVPDIGDAKNVVVSELLVQAGEAVTAGQPLLVLESDKASMEIEAPAAGTLTRFAVAAGDEVAEGTVVAVIAGAAAPNDRTKPSAAKAAAQPSAAPASKAPVAKDAATPAAAAQAPASAVSRPAAAAEDASASARVYAGPAVRKMARELGVALAEVKGSGARGRVVKEDVNGYVKGRLSGAAATPRTAADGAAGIPPIPSVDFAKYGPVEEQKLSRIMRVGGVNLHRSWLNLPHVTHNDEADITELEVFRKSLRDEAQKAGVKLTPLPFLVKACVAALKAFPRINASLAPSKDTLILKRYFHIGVAVDTPDGLVVPVVKNADQKGLYELANDIADLSERARGGKLKPDEMAGGTFSISSLGALGGTSFTPIINAPEVAILGVAKLATKPVWNGDAFAPRQMLPLSLSYDHRVINGADAARFTTQLVQLLGDFRRVLL